jgi:poly(3-hydroxybutyrate) depolymerase
MPSFPVSSLIRALSCTAVCALGLAACGGGGETADVDATSAAAPESRRGPLAVATANTLQLGVQVPGFPHKVDVYRPAGATKAIVFLHGHGGRTWQSAYDLGFNRKRQPQTAKNVNWDWLVRNGTMAIFPQGQALPGTTVPTWSNYVFDSGQDDVAFLAALSRHVTAQYGATQVALAGHSSGGTMTARMWCESTPSFKAYFSIAGPMPSPSYPAWGGTCTPLAPAPYGVVIGDHDTKLSQFAAGVLSPTPQQLAVGLTDTILVSEWGRHDDRSAKACGDTAVLDERSVAATGSTWSGCSSSIRYTVVAGADHPIASLEKYGGVRMVDAIASLAASAPAGP